MGPKQQPRTNPEPGPTRETTKLNCTVKRLFHPCCGATVRTRLLYRLPPGIATSAELAPATSVVSSSDSARRHSALRCPPD
jgi:hypothetical protein